MIQRPGTASFRLVVLLCALFTVAPARGGQRLGYHCAPGSLERMVIEDEFDLPSGVQASTLHIDTTVESADAAGSRLHQQIQRSAPRKPDRTVAAKLAITPTGEVTGPDAVPEDAEGAFLARSTLLLLPALPDRPVEVGSTWSAERTFPLPPMPVSAPPQVRVRTGYRLASFSDGGRVANLTVEARQLNGEKLDLTYTGELAVDVKTGRPLSGHIGGTATISALLFVPVSATFKIRLVSSAVEAHARGERISLLGVQD